MKQQHNQQLKLLELITFIYIVDQARTSLHIRFEQFQKYEETFGLLFNLKKLKDVDNDSLKSFCINLEGFLKHGEHSDIDGKDLFIERRIWRETLPNEINRAVEVLKYIRQMDGCFPNAWVAYRILLTIPVTVASAKRSFLKIKIDQIISSINYVIRKIEWVSYFVN